jgi:hypothetical protein
MSEIITKLTTPFAIACLLVLSGCVTKPPMYDYSAFQKAKPASLLVLPPLSESQDVKASPAVWAHATKPLAEAGYYVMPITLVDETFRGNGVMTATDAHEVPFIKLHDYFGADAGVYIKIKKYGTTYKLIDSETRVEVEAKVVDLRDGNLLWEGKAVASSAEQNQQSQGGLLGLLVAAIVKQIMNSTTDAAFGFAGLADARLLTAPRFNGILPGPRSPQYGQPPVTQ